MNTLLACLSIAGVIAASPVAAAPLAAATPAATAPVASRQQNPSLPDLWSWIMSAASDALDRGAEPASLSSLLPFQYTPATAEKLNVIFGHRQPLRVTAQAAPRGAKRWLFSLRPLKRTDTQGNHLEWSAITGSMSAGAATQPRSVAMTGALLAYQTDRPGLRLQDFTFDLQQNRPGAESRHYALSGKFGQIVLPVAGWFGAADAVPLHLEGARFGSRLAPSGKEDELTYEVHARSIWLAGQKLQQPHIKLRITNIGNALASRLNRELMTMLAGHLQPGPAPAASMEEFEEILGLALRDGARIHLDDFSVRYNGNTWATQGQINPGSAEARDQLSGRQVLALAEVRLQSRLPVAILRDYAYAQVRQQIGAQRGQPASAAEIAAAADPAIKETLRTLVDSGYARLDNQVLHSAISYRGGRLTSDGKEVNLPALLTRDAGAGPDSIADQKGQ